MRLHIFAALSLVGCGSVSARSDAGSDGRQVDGVVDAVDAPPDTPIDGGFEPMGATYIKASNTETQDLFGTGIALSADGTTLAIGAWREDSGATGIGGNQTDNSVADSGAVYVFKRSGATWNQQAYLKASNPGASDSFGFSVALSADGNTLAVGASSEDSNAVGINQSETDNSAANAGAVYIFTRSGTTWSQQAYVKASNTEAGDQFGYRVALSDDGNTMAVTALNEDGGTSGVNGNQADNTASRSGAIYVFTRIGITWTQQAYVKASTPGANDNFGHGLDLSSDGNTLAAGTWFEASTATGIDGDQTDNTAANAGAAYVFVRSGTTWSQQAYVKATNTDADDWFGMDVALSGDGNTLAVGAPGEGSSATGIDGDQTDNTAKSAGAVYVYKRSGATWAVEAYVKASNAEAGDQLGWYVDLAADGNTLVMSAQSEDSADIGVDADQTNNAASNAGAVYVLTRSGTTWVQQHYLKSPNAEANDQFGSSGLMISADATTIAVSTQQEDSAAKGVGGSQADNTATDSGAAYVFQ